MSVLAIGNEINTRVVCKFNKIIHHMASCNFKLDLIRKKITSQSVNYHNKVEAAVNKQIICEQQASMNYLNMAIYFLHPSVSYVGVGKYFMEMYKEELGHMEVLISYQLTRGGKPIVNTETKCEETAKDSLTVLAAFIRALQMETLITEQLQSVVSTAEASKDYQCADFITSKFLKEQVHSVNELSHHVTVLHRISDSEHALWLFDKHVLKSPLHSPKT